jgi:hypothetical protein
MARSGRRSSLPDRCVPAGSRPGPTDGSWSCPKLVKGALQCSLAASITGSAFQISVAYASLPLGTSGGDDERLGKGDHDSR